MGARPQRDVVEGGEGPPADRRGAVGIHRGGGGGGEELPCRGGAALRWPGGAGGQAGCAGARSEAAGCACAHARGLHQPPGPASERGLHCIYRKRLMKILCMLGVQLGLGAAKLESWISLQWFLIIYCDFTLLDILNFVLRKEHAFATKAKGGVS